MNLHDDTYFSFTLWGDMLMVFGLCKGHVQRRCRYIRMEKDTSQTSYKHRKPDLTVV